ncbi:sensor histidine kinase [Roseivirga sp. E12]|uniref:sensor histidine kinase n=1 Tax=Roseivirga sp. E12 TaxID=2819237 RepID=UPI001ABBED99|nr:histidine kinase [Roseivirga sp. E12]MBO3697347.1 histidine kinase [Roseivirga sp. E12]
MILFIFWTFIAVFLSTQLYFNGVKNGLTTSWLVVFKGQIPIWYSWAIITPLILHMVNRFPISVDNLFKPVLIYVLFGIGLLFIITNLTLVYMFITHGYIDLRNTSIQEYSPYFFSRISNDTLIYVFLLAIIISVRAYSIRKKNELDLALAQFKNDQLQNELTQAQLQALKLQLNPHFLFNTLHTISSLTLVGQNESSANVTTRLGDFLRRTLDFEEHQLVSLSKELEFFDLYLDIESVRFQDRLVIEKEIHPDCLGLKVPNLLLQPLVENAVKHGIAKSKSASLISLSISLSDDLISIRLYNDGPSFNDKGEKGIGLQNIKNRLDRLYGEDYRFEIENDTSNKGVMTILDIPTSSPILNE